MLIFYCSNKIKIKTLIFVLIFAVGKMSWCKSPKTVYKIKKTNVIIFIEYRHYRVSSIDSIDKSPVNLYYLFFIII